LLAAAVTPRLLAPGAVNENAPHGSAAAQKK
jgi:hypothetical protein